MSTNTSKKRRLSSVDKDTTVSEGFEQPPPDKKQKAEDQDETAETESGRQDPPIIPTFEKGFISHTEVNQLVVAIKKYYTENLKAVTSLDVGCLSIVAEFIRPPLEAVYQRMFDSLCKVQPADHWCFIYGFGKGELERSACLKQPFYPLFTAKWWSEFGNPTGYHLLHCLRWRKVNCFQWHVFLNKSCWYLECADSDDHETFSDECDRYCDMEQHPDEDDEIIVSQLEWDASSNIFQSKCLFTFERTDSIRAMESHGSSELCLCPETYAWPTSKSIDTLYLGCSTEKNARQSRWSEYLAILVQLCQEEEHMHC